MQISQKIITLFEEDKFDICHLYFSKFESVLTQIPTEQVIIPSNLRRRRTDEVNLHKKHAMSMSLVKLKS